MPRHKSTPKRFTGQGVPLERILQAFRGEPRDMSKRRKFSPRSAGVAGLLRTKRKADVALALAVPGFTRTSGNFGRYGPQVSNPELKYHDIDVDDAVIAATGTIQNTGSVNLIAQGTSEVQRIGRKCVIRSIGWRYNITLPSATSAAKTSETVRVIMYLDKQANGATAAVTDIIKTDNYQSFNNLSNKSRFRTLHDKTYDLIIPTMADLAGPSTNTGEFTVNASFYKKCNIPLEFSSTAGAITEIRSNNLGVLLLSAGGHAVFDSKMRLRFSDS